MVAISKVLRESIDAGLIPIVNGNDPADDQKTNNDLVAASVAVMTRATHLLLLTDVPRVYLDADSPTHVDEMHVDEIEIIRVRQGGSGTGGIRSKLRAAEATAWNGVETRISGAREQNAIRSIIQGTPHGTLVRTDSTVGDRVHYAERLRWISGGATPQGEVTINAEAERSISASDRDRKSTRLNSSHYCASRMPSSA